MHVSRCHLPQTTYESAILRVLGGLANAMGIVEAYSNNSGPSTESSIERSLVTRDAA